jgi:hypothetical protein
MPDAARVLLDVGLAQEHGQTFHLPGDGPTTPQTLFSQAIRIAGAGNFAALPGWTVRAAGVTVARAFADILHLWEAPVLLDGTKLRARLLGLRSTPYEKGLAVKNGKRRIGLGDLAELTTRTSLRLMPTAVRYSAT